MDLIQYIGVALAGLAASLLSGFAGSGGGLISTPFLIFVGIPPHVAVATIRFASLGNSIGALQRFIKGKQVLWRLTVPLSLISLVVAFFGAQFLLTLDARIVKQVVAGTMLVLAPFVLLKGKHGIQEIPKGIISKTVGYITYAGVAFFHAAFGSGIATFLNYTLIYLFGTTATQASATRRIPTIVLSIVTVITFATHGAIDYVSGIILFISMYIGASIGAKFAMLKGNVWVLRALGLVVLASAIKLLV